MANVYYTNRYNNWKKYKDYYAAIPKMGKDFDAFMNFFFDKESSFGIFFKFLRDQASYPGDKNDALKLFACDLDWAKNLDACKSSSNSSQQNTGNQNQNINPNQSRGNSSQNTDISSQEVLGGEKTVSFGMKGDIVRTIQDYLKTNKDSNGNSYFNKNSTSYFGSVTKDAVIQFQKDKNLSRKDGVVDKETMEALMNKKTKKDKVKFEPLDTEDADVWYESIKSKIIKENKEDLIKQKNNILKAQYLGCIPTFDDGEFGKRNDIAIYYGTSKEKFTIIFYGDISDDGTITIENYTKTEENNGTPVIRTTKCEKWVEKKPDPIIDTKSKTDIEKEKEQENLKKLDSELKPYGYTVTAPDNVSDPGYREKTVLTYVPIIGPDLKQKYGKDYTVYGYYGTDRIGSEKPILNKSGCKDNVKKLHGFLQSPNSELARTYKQKSDLLQQLKNNVAYCKNNNIVRGDDLDDLYKFDSQSNIFGMADFKQTNESMKSIRKTIKESLKEVSVKKKNLLKEEKIINNRFQMIAENFDGKQKNKFYDEILSEMVYLNSQGFESQVINEQFTEFLKSIFGHKWDAIGQTFLEHIMTWVLNKLGLPKDSVWSEMISTSFANLPLSNISTILTCDGMTKWLSTSVTEGMIKHLQTTAGLDNLFVDSLRNALVDTIKDDTEFGKKVEGLLAKLVCPGLSSLQGKFDGAEEQMKNAALSIN